MKKENTQIKLYNLDKGVIWLKSVPKVREILLDEEIDEQEFVDIINGIYKQDCYIYAVISWMGRRTI
ncbi:hypothetical protein FC682_25880 [Peribacillus simplex]|nr:hypothetical protein FC682_25880 [Peribacillus simplex]